MKKTISINIAGSIFYIEEDGYDQLRAYLNAIQKYFAGFEDNQEIVSDIEARIAERFVKKQKAETKQGISLGDVDELIAAMGTVADFEAMQPNDEPAATTTRPEATAAPTQPNEQAEAPKKRRLERDLQRKVLGGVAAGLANYFNTDRAFVRLGFLFAFFGLTPFAGGDNNFWVSLSGFTLLTYIIMWIAFPGSVFMQEGTSKKLFRDQDNKVIGGVAAGLAAYFKVDVAIVRIAFVLAVLFFGVGIFAYLLMWIAVPKATTLTQKMEMQGEPVTLSNIETSVKKNLNNETGAESGLTKLLLLPFRIIAAIFEVLGRVFRSFGSVLRVLVGLFVVGISFVVLGSFLLAGGVGLGLSDTPFVRMGPVPFAFFAHEISPLLLLSGFLSGALPFLAMLLLGVALVANRRVVSRNSWLTGLGVWVVSLLVFIATLTSFLGNFSRKGEIEKNEVFSMTDGIIFDKKQAGDDFFQNTSLDLEGWEQGNLKLVSYFEAEGRSRADAEANARQITYNVSQKDSVLRFDENFTLNRKAAFRNQKLRLTLYVPYQKPFSMTRAFFQEFDPEMAYNYNLEYFEANDERFKTLRWAFKKDSGLVCLNKDVMIYETQNDPSPGEESSNLEAIGDDIQQNLDNAFGDAFDPDQKGNKSKLFDVKDFTGLDLGGAYVISVVKGNTYKVEVDCDDDQKLQNIRAQVTDGILNIKQDRDLSFSENNNKRIGLTITMPMLRNIDLSGVSNTKVTGFDNLADLKIGISGASKSYFDVRAKNIDLSVSGTANVKLIGAADAIKVGLSGACKLDATQMQIGRANVSASGVSNANFGRVDNLEQSTSGASRVSRTQ